MFINYDLVAPVCTLPTAFVDFGLLVLSFCGPFGNIITMIALSGICVGWIDCQNLLVIFTYAVVYRRVKQQGQYKYLSALCSFLHLLK